MLTAKDLFSMRPPVRSLVLLYWIYSFVGCIVGMFGQIYVYQLFKNVEVSILASMVVFTGVAFGFCVCGVVAAHYRWNIRYSFPLGFCMIALSLPLLLTATTIPMALIALGIGGIGDGFFWLAIHTYELLETNDHERDTYSTFLSVGDQINSFAGPALATAFIWVSLMFGWRDLTLLFIVTPLLYLSGLGFFRHLRTYRPNPIKWHDVTHFIFDPRNQRAQWYMVPSGGNHMLREVLFPLLAITILGSNLSVGGFSTILAIVGILTLLIIGSYRHSDNRLSLLALSSVLLAILTILMGYLMNLPMLVIYSIGMVLIMPIIRVSQHTIDLQTMESIGHKDSDFYPTMIFRDISFWIWRIVAGLILLAIVHVGTTSNTQAISTGFYLIAGLFVLTYVGARALLALQPKTQS